MTVLNKLEMFGGSIHDRSLCGAPMQMEADMSVKGRFPADQKNFAPKQIHKS